MTARTLGLAVLGATGSIGASTLDVAGRHPQRYRIRALTAHTSAEELLSACRRHRAELAVLSGMAADAALRRRYGEAQGIHGHALAAQCNSTAATGNVDSMLSSRSRMPPCPGSNDPLSLTPARRLSADSNRSPRMLTAHSSSTMPR